MERKFNDFKGKVIEDFNGKLYFVNGLTQNPTTSKKMVVYTSLDASHKVFTMPENEFLNSTNSSQTYRFFVSNKIVSPTDSLILQDDQSLKNSGFANIPKPRKWVIVQFIIFFILSFIAIVIIAYIKTFN